MIELRTKKRINEEYLKQDFHTHVRGNGEIIKVSDDFKYFYRPDY